MTPKEFEEAMLKIYNEGDYDPEDAHYKIDELMWAILFENGYSDGIKISDKMTFWYA